MNYVLIQENFKRKTLEIIINNIKNVDAKSEIFVVTNEKWNQRNIIVIQKHELLDKRFLDYFESINTPRLLILTEIFTRFSLKNAIHFDEDVLLLKKFDDINYLFKKNKINIINNNLSKFSYGFSYFDNMDLLFNLSKKYINYIERLKIVKNLNTNSFSELYILKDIYFENLNLFHFLPVLPIDYEIAFDPISYGRYLLGSSYLKKILLPGNYRYLDEDVGIEISSNRLRLSLKKEILKLKWNEKNFELASLKTFGVDKLLRIS